jgi:UDP-N-acetylglucosamine 2-epimerase
MSPVKAVVATGTRPEVIELAPVVAALRARPWQFSTMVSTARCSIERWRSSASRRTTTST